MKSRTLYATLLLTGLLLWTSCQNNPKPATIIVNPKGEMTAFGRPVADFEALKTALVDSLVNMAQIPEKIDIRFEGELGMGIRQEVETIATEAIESAKLAKIAPMVDIQNFRKEHGTDCDKPDSLRTFCATIDLLYPVVVKGEKALQDSVGIWSTHYLIAILDGDPDSKAATLEAAAAAFFKNHDSYKGSAMGGAFDARTGSEVVYNNGKYLTLAIHGDTYQGGAHGSVTQALNTFDAQTGKILTWDDLVTDKKALQDLAEKKVREVKAEAFKEGFNFDKDFPFALPASYGLTKEGLLLFYVPYEIMPYALGETEALITFEELGVLSKIRL